MTKTFCDICGEPAATPPTAAEAHKAKDGKITEFYLTLHFEALGLRNAGRPDLCRTCIRRLILLAFDRTDSLT